MGITGSRVTMDEVNRTDANNGEDAEGVRGGKEETIMEMNLLDLPESLLLKILSYTDHDFLRHVISKVSVAFRKVARSHCLWKNAFLNYSAHDCWDENPGEKFVEDLKVTPYVHHLFINVTLQENHDTFVLKSLMNTRCQIYKLALHVECYGPEWLLLLQRHPEIRELELADNADDDMYTAGVAAAVGALLPRLNVLDLSHSRLLQFPETGKLVWEPSVRLLGGGNEPEEAPVWFPADDNKIVPAGYESYNQVAEEKLLDLRDVEVEVDDDPVRIKDKERYMKTQPLQGLRHFKFEPYNMYNALPSSQWVAVEAITATNVAALIRSQRNHLRSIYLDFGLPLVYEALGQTKCLEKAYVYSDPTGAGVRSMVQALSSSGGGGRLHTLRLYLPGALGAAGAADIVQTLGRCRQGLPALDTLELAGEWRRTADRSTSNLTGNVFPGFRAFAGLLQGTTLRTVRVTECGPVGRAEMEQLLQLAAPPRTVSLRRLELNDCACSAGRAWADCRDRADKQVARALPDLEIEIANRFMGFDDRYDAGFMPMHTCDCERRPPPGQRANGPGHQGHPAGDNANARGGRGQGRGQRRGRGRGRARALWPPVVWADV